MTFTGFQNLPFFFAVITEHSNCRSEYARSLLLESFTYMMSDSLTKRAQMTWQERYPLGLLHVAHCRKKWLLNQNKGQVINFTYLIRLKWINELAIFIWYQYDETTGAYNELRMSRLYRLTAKRL